MKLYSSFEHKDVDGFDGRGTLVVTRAVVVNHWTRQMYAMVQ